VDSKRDISTVLFDLGLAYNNAHRTKDAMAVLQRALDSAEAEFGADSLDAASVLAGMLVTAEAGGEPERAREYGVRALPIRENKLGRDHEQVARLLGDLAMNAIDRKRPREAMPLIERALSVIEKPGAPALSVRFAMRGIRARAELALSRPDAALADARIAR